MSLTTSHVVPAPREQVWEWHTRPGALVRLTPPFLPFIPMKQADKLSDGTTIFGLPAGLKWVSRHDLSNYRRGHRFTDVCINAPVKNLANWRHVHDFADHEDGTLVTDTVTTRLPATTMTSFFAYRQQQLINDFLFLERVAHLQPEKPLTIAMTGSRGLVGRALMAQLGTAGHKVIQLVRRNPKPDQRLWDSFSPAPDLLDGIDVLVHLAGEPIFGRFSAGHKQAIRDSRVTPTNRLARLVAESPSVHTMIAASAVGYYGSDRGDEVLTESAGCSPPVWVAASATVRSGSRGSPSTTPPTSCSVEPSTPPGPAPSTRSPPRRPSTRTSPPPCPGSCAAPPSSPSPPSVRRSSSAARVPRSSRWPTSGSCRRGFSTPTTPSATPPSTGRSPTSWGESRCVTPSGSWMRRTSTSS